ncbi:hypothetical protein [Niveibacterium microcysteis]|uniref:Uncharacterized protein n=1 Tax=Niveibacterium microcysteis TaxID=2811415 RepID=A0ABX7MFB0_9RHOO|nr:hypothetical protein [Niveibacterium microcysteis]QSI78677.1 hypothetical protein JY500_08755 [Niveibacterium microcysteis]
MSQFKLEKRLPSCTVSKDLLKELETYLLAKAKTLSGGEDLEDRHFRVCIHDDLGVEAVSNVESVPGRQFLDSTNQVTLDLDLRYGKLAFPLQVEVRFDKDRTFSRLTVSYTGDDARAVVAGLHDGIMRLILSAKNGNVFFNPSPFLEGALWGGCSLSLLLSSIVAKVMPTVFAVGAFVIALTFIYLIAGKRLRPYTAFDSPTTDRNSKLADWFVYGLAGFVLFGSLLAVVRRSYFGF